MDPTQFQKIRHDNNMTQKDLADILGLTERQVRNYENGSTEIPRPVEKMLERLEEEPEFQTDVQTFLLGGSVGVSPYRQRDVEGFHCLLGSRHEAKENLDSLDNFRSAIETILSMYGWDPRECVCVDLPARGKIQKFDMPSEEIIRAMYDLEKSDQANFYDEE